MLTSIRSRRYLVPVFFAMSFVLLIVAGFVWWNFIYQSPSRVFWGMMENNLQTSSVTKHIVGGANGQTVSQYVRLQLGSTNASQWLVTIKQADSKATTESIGTPKGDYVRYLELKAPANKKHADGSAYNFSSVINVWAKADAGSTSAPQQLFSQTILDMITAPIPTPPIGNVSPENQQNITKFMRDQTVFMPDYKTMQRKELDGRKVYVYKVSVKLAPYIRMMQAFAHDVGLRDLDSIDPLQYQSAPPVKLIFTVDAAGHQLRAVSNESQGYTQSYSDYGLTTPIQIPAKTISFTELQTRLQKL